ncbi:hypothetical protein CERSUDRAFT_148888 [Gelatoporia subvermispora B]|uniref:Nucleoporin Nup82 n=1 Tax=Ceriporiopsis subvermispora (strain B) TaxID=914234 RepID=M2PV38_CERS8|nr:hypothetical protein CERSUDRAFT_148888 [Gelatoporia subvermispora B]
MQLTPQEDDWDALFKDHPIFELAKDSKLARRDISLELSLSSLPDFTSLDPENDSPAPSGRRQTMLIKDSELIVAVGNEIRMTNLGDSRVGKATRKSYKILHTPNVTFDIHHMALNPNGKLLAVAGAFQVAVVVLPRAGFTRLVPTIVDCKSLQIGQYYHAANSSAPIAQVEWHPWGEGGSTLLVMTIDGKLREYDISMDADEPQQVLSFVPERKRNTFDATDASEREVASFSLGKGRADWGPLTIYALMRSGDIYSICPYIPQNTSIPSSYVHALECFVAAKQEYLSRSSSGASTSNLSAVYDYQHKYVTALMKQLPPGTVFPAPSRLVTVHPPTTIKSSPKRQGPFLLQPSPRNLEGSEGGDATDMIYMSFGNNVDADEEKADRIGVVLVTFQDGKVDVYLDVEKVEARWDHKEHPQDDLPMLAVYEIIDLGVVSTLKKITTRQSEPSLLGLLSGNYPVFLPDPIQDDTVYVHHAFGVHALQLAPLIDFTKTASRLQDSATSASTLKNSAGTNVFPLVSTFSVEHRSSSPVVGVAVPNDVYLTYSIFVLTAALRVTVLPLNLRPDSPTLPSSELPPVSPTDSPTRASRHHTDAAEARPYVSLLGSESFVLPPILASPSGLPHNALLSLPASARGEFQLTPDTLRFLASTAERLSTQKHEALLAHRTAEAREELQRQEFRRQQEKLRELLDRVTGLKDARQAKTQEKIRKAQEAQKTLLARMDRTLRALMEKASPELSEHETKWFEELRRMKEEVVGAGRYDERSLVTRTNLLRKEVDRLLPALKQLSERERERKRRLSENCESLGASQAFELGERSSEERVRIGKLEKELLRIADKLDTTLGRPPSHRGQPSES